MEQETAAPTGTFDRDKAREMLRPLLKTGQGGYDPEEMDRTLDALEACVLPDPRIERALEPLNSMEWPSDQARLRAIEILKYGAD